VLPLLLERYPVMHAYRRGYELAEARAGAVLGTAPDGAARVAWEAALPRAYREHVDRYGPAAGNPDHFLYSIMLKESRFAPHEVSYADARGLLQLLPELGGEIARDLGIPFFADQLFDPEVNIRLAAAHLGKLFKMFGGQPFLVAAAYNGGVKATARWLDQQGKRPLDEFVELIAYEQSRDYVKRVIGIYARYRYLYAEPYELPLTVDPNYRKEAQGLY
jgi:soluble lytic murein transglycosylase